MSNSALAVVLKLVCADRQSAYVTMFDQLFCGFAAFGVIEHTVRIYATISTVEQRLTQNIVGVVMLMVPYKRNGFAVMVLERIRHNGSTVGAFQIAARSPTSEIIAVSA
jgi:hypothetical protein